ncbi:peptidase associated/transthyretin-like domain-containing protein [Edaphocola aurantiacus]|uniref:hypothetical protein n=1 Tax=Edaphocola aurantiacus TaxID=2601682 RepID=UPI001C973011|nr:hypothetical protein [Edaphocola aurantiacus]
MNRLFLLIILLFLALQAGAQKTLSGVVMDLERSEPVPYVTLTNLRTDMATQAGAKGAFNLEAKAGDRIKINRLGVESTVFTVTEEMFSSYQRIIVQYSIGTLAEVDVTALTPYQRDSLYRDSLYRPTLARKKDKAEVVITPVGILITNPLSSWVQYLVPKTRQKWKFQKNFAKWEEQKFVETVYTPELVASITGLKGDSCAYFMNTYPIPVQMARTAKETELKSWIKANYLDYTSSKR